MILNFIIIFVLHSVKCDDLERRKEENITNRIEIENQDHIARSIDTLLNQDEIMNYQKSGRVKKVEQMSAKLKLVIPSDEYKAPAASIDIMNGTFKEMFSRPRNDYFSKILKNNSRNMIINKLEEYNFQGFTQEFSVRKNGIIHRGLNIIGILPGKYRRTKNEEILLLGAHYDTVDKSPGTDDNASGMVAILEVGRLLSLLPEQLNHTVMIVAFDLEELGLLGSMAFVREYLIPKELLLNKSKFLGAYITDMVLNYDSNLNTQTLPRDVQNGSPDMAKKIQREGNRGDFIGIWARRQVDTSVAEAFQKTWIEFNDSPKVKLRTFDPPLPSTSPSANELYRYGTFTRSDHASFWYHKLVNYPKSLKAILLTDMGPWRGVHKKCYHSWCDDFRQLTPKNLKFLKLVVDVLYNVVAFKPPKYQESIKRPGNRRRTGRRRSN